MKRFTYSSRRRSRGLAEMFSSVVCLFLFAFFLVAGFDGWRFLALALGLLSFAAFWLFLHGFGLYQSGSGTLEVDDAGIQATRGKKNVFLPWASILVVRMGRLLQPALVLKGSHQKIVVYKSLSDYPQFWNFLHGKAALPALHARTITVRCMPRQAGVFIFVLVFSLSALAAVLYADRASSFEFGVAIALLLLPGMVSIAILLTGWKAFVFTRQGFSCQTILRRTVCSAKQIQSVTLDQAPVQMLITGWRYRGPALTSAALFSNDVGLRICITHTCGETVLDETTTNFPLELLYDALQEWYAVSAPQNALSPVV